MNHFGSGNSSFTRQIIGECRICQHGPVNLVLLSSQCNHQASACETCHANFISQEIESKGTHRFACPISSCSIEFEPQEYYHLLTVRQREIIEKILLFRTLEADEEFRWCKSDQGCGTGQLVSNYKDLLGFVKFNEMA